MVSCSICEGAGASLRCRGMASCRKRIHDACLEGEEWVCEECTEAEKEEPKTPKRQKGGKKAGSASKEKVDKKGRSSAKKTPVSAGKKQPKPRESAKKTPKKEAKSEFDENLEAVLDKVGEVISSDMKTSYHKIEANLRRGQYKDAEGWKKYFEDLLKLYIQQEYENVVRLIFKKVLSPNLVIQLMKHEVSWAGDASTHEEATSLAATYLDHMDTDHILQVPPSISARLKYLRPLDTTCTNMLDFYANLRHWCRYLDQLLPNQGHPLKTVAADMWWWMVPVVRRGFKGIGGVMRARSTRELKWVLTEQEKRVGLGMQEAKEVKERKGRKRGREGKEAKEEPPKKKKSEEFDFGFSCKLVHEASDDEAGDDVRPQEAEAHDDDCKLEVVPEGLYTANIIGPPSDEENDDDADELPPPEAIYAPSSKTFRPLYPDYDTFHKKAGLLQGKEKQADGDSDDEPADPSLTYEQEVCERLKKRNHSKAVLRILAGMLPVEQGAELLNFPTQEEVSENTNRGLFD